MKRIYLASDGTVRTPTAAEHSHPGMARTILGPDWHGNNDDTYTAIWQAGWVRVVETDTEVHGEKYLDRCPVPFDALPAEQQVWFGEKTGVEGKLFIWNSEEFAGTREVQPNAARAVQMLMEG